MNSLGFICIILSYLIGSIPFGLLLSKHTGVDIRHQGSKNIGATNVTRLLGKKMGALTLICDVLKGFLPMFLTALVVIGTHAEHWVIAMSGAASVLGHMFPVYLKFKGGKGVATALGAFLYLEPLAVIGCLVVFVVTVYFTGFVSLGSLLGSASILLWLIMVHTPHWKLGLALFVVILIWLKHSPNIARLRRGTEKTWNGKDETRR